MDRIVEVKKSNSHTPQTAALLTGLLLLLLSALSLLLILLPRTASTAYTAEIYRDGQLLRSIDLSAVSSSYTFRLEGTDGYNEIEVRHGSIGIISADCPDKLCVHQGFISSSALPITCLPNRLVIRLRPTVVSDDPAAVDMNTY